MCEWVSEWLIACVLDWLIARLSEWVSQSINQSISQLLCAIFYIQCFSKLCVSEQWAPRGGPRRSSPARERRRHAALLRSPSQEILAVCLPGNSWFYQGFIRVFAGFQNSGLLVPGSWLLGVQTGKKMMSESASWTATVKLSCVSQISWIWYWLYVLV